MGCTLQPVGCTVQPGMQPGMQPNGCMMQPIGCTVQPTGCTGQPKRLLLLFLLLSFLIRLILPLGPQHCDLKNKCTETEIPR